MLQAYGYLPSVRGLEILVDSLVYARALTYRLVSKSQNS